MAHGGKREGAGKPKGAVHKRNKQIAEQAIAGRMTPLEVMLDAMYDAQARGDKAEAATYAKDAAPYCHAKLQATTISGDAKNPVVVTSMDAKEALIFAETLRSEYIGE